jgi:hypothetical protein
MRQFMLAAVFLALAVPEVSAQIRASELASVSQTVDGTTTIVNYSRPRARGRRGLRLRVSPSYSTTVTPEIAKRIAGTYQVKMEPEPQSNDSSNPTPDRIARNVKLTIRAEGNELRGVMDPPLFETEEGYKNWILIPTKGGWLYFGRIHEGELVEVVDFFQVQFDTAGERAAGFEIRAFNDALIGKGTRLR